VSVLVIANTANLVIRGRLSSRPYYFARSHSAMPRILAIALILIFSGTNPALAKWWLVRSSDGKCLVVDIEPTDQDKNVTKMGKDVYQSAEGAEADAKRLCKNAKPPDKSGPSR
jgi:hypothetical protein